MPQQTFIVDGQFLGQAERQPFTSLFHSGRPPGYAAFCPVCCDLWARCPIEGEPTTILTLACRRHGRPSRSGLWVPGSLLLGWDPEFVEAWPDAVLRREIEVQCDNLERLENERS